MMFTKFISTTEFKWTWPFCSRQSGQSQWYRKTKIKIHTIIINTENLCKSTTEFGILSSQVVVHDMVYNHDFVKTSQVNDKMYVFSKISESVPRGSIPSPWNNWVILFKKQFLVLVVQKYQSSLWVLMAWCYSTRASVSTVMIMHPCASRYFMSKNFKKISFFSIIMFFCISKPISTLEHIPHRWVQCLSCLNLLWGERWKQVSSNKLVQFITTKFQWLSK